MKQAQSVWVGATGGHCNMQKHNGYCTLDHFYSQPVKWALPSQEDRNLNCSGVRSVFMDGSFYGAIRNRRPMGQGAPISQGLCLLGEIIWSKVLKIICINTLQNTV